jgi:hypothetical protein
MVNLAVLADDVRCAQDGVVQNGQNVVAGPDGVVPDGPNVVAGPDAVVQNAADVIVPPGYRLRQQDAEERSHLVFGMYLADVSFSGSGNYRHPDHPFEWAAEWYQKLERGEDPLLLKLHHCAGQKDIEVFRLYLFVVY